MSAVMGRECWIEKELLELFCAVVDDYRSGAIDEETFRKRLYKIAETYERHSGKQSAPQEELF